MVGGTSLPMIWAPSASTVPCMTLFFQSGGKSWPAMGEPSKRMSVLTLPPRHWA